MKKMCSTIFIKALTDDDKPYPIEPNELVFESPELFTPDKPTCTCWIGDKEGDGKILRQSFVEECLQPFLQKISWGKIVIEIH